MTPSHFGSILPMYMPCLFTISSSILPFSLIELGSPGKFSRPILALASSWANMKHPCCLADIISVSIVFQKSSILVMSSSSWHSGRPEHLLSKEALVKQATSLRGLCEAHVHLGLGEEWECICMIITIHERDLTSHLAQEGHEPHISHEVMGCFS